MQGRAGSDYSEFLGGTSDSVSGQEIEVSGTYVVKQVSPGDAGDDADVRRVLLEIGASDEAWRTTRAIPGAYYCSRNVDRCAYSCLHYFGSASSHAALRALPCSAERVTTAW